MTLRQLWLMAAGAAESRRLLALDVRNLIGVGRFDAERYVRTGFIAEWSAVTEFPDTPLMREAEEKLRREQEGGS